MKDGLSGQPAIVDDQPKMASNAGLFGHLTGNDKRFPQ